jgi:hypothetical protein
MDLWYPPKDRPHLLEWWRPLILASRAARIERCPWPIHVDELVLRGRVSRKGRPDIWVYAHPGSGGELYLDHSGQAYTFTRTPRAKSYGRFLPCEIHMAIWRARLPDVVAPISYDNPPADHRVWMSGTAPAGWADAPVAGGHELLAAAGEHEVAAMGSPALDAGSAAVAVSRHPAGGGEGARRGPRRRRHLTVYDGGRSLAG